MMQLHVPHLEATKHILWYFQRTTDQGILFKKRRQSEVTNYTNADWVRDTKSQKLIEGYVFQLGGNLITWCNKRQQIVGCKQAH
jgi:hypothetical protein